MAVLRVPYSVLFPMILLFCIIGVYTISSNIWDIVIMLAFGAVGYAMRKFGYEPLPLVLAFVLGRMAEEAIRQSLLLSRGSLTILLSRPIAGAFLGAAVALVVLPIALPRLRSAVRVAGELGETH